MTLSLCAAREPTTCGWRADKYVIRKAFETFTARINSGKNENSIGFRCQRGIVVDVCGAFEWRAEETFRCV